MEGYLHLSEGGTFKGTFSGNAPEKDLAGEIVFFTGMTGYQEVLTDPSYKDQIVVFTYPLIGNYGINKEDSESIKPQPAAVIVYEASEQGFHYESEVSLTSYLEKWNVPVLSHIDTRAVVKKIREKIPGVVLRTTLIAGFPGETEEQFCELCEFLKEAKFERVGCFAYSREEGTVAYDFEDQIDSEIAQKRADIIMRAQQRTVDEFNEKMIGKTVTVAVEGYDRYGECYFGRSEFDAPDIDGKIFFASQSPLRIGDFVAVHITDAMDYDLMGEALLPEEGGNK